MTERAAGSDPRGPDGELEAIARDIVRASPVRFALAETRAEREAVFRLRAEVPIERGWARPEDIPDGLERDHHDERALLVAGWDGPILAAAGRVILPRNDPLPVEETFGLVVPDRNRTAELGRIVVARPYRSLRRGALLALLCAMWLEMRARGCDRITGSADAAMLRLYGIFADVEVLGDSVSYRNVQRWPMLATPTVERVVAARAVASG